MSRCPFCNALVERQKPKQVQYLCGTIVEADQQIRPWACQEITRLNQYIKVLEAEEGSTTITKDEHALNCPCPACVADPIKQAELQAVRRLQGIKS